MFFIYYKLDNRKQLSGLNNEKILEILSRSSAILHEAGGSPVDPDEQIYQFAALYKETALSVLDAAIRLKKHLDENSDHLFGFSIILSADHDNEDLDVHFHNLSLLAEEEDCIWMEESAVSRYSAFVDVPESSETSPLLPVKVKTEKMLFLEDLYRNFLNRPDQIAPVKNEINQWLFREDQPEALYIKTKDPDESLMILKEVFEDQRALVEQFLLLEPAEGCWDPLYPLVNFINREFLNHAGQYLSPDQRNQWLKDGPFLQKICQNDWYLQCSDQFFTEFAEAVRLYWAACLRKLDTYPTPPVLIIREPERFSPEARELLKELLQGFLTDQPSQKYIFLSREDGLSEPFDDLSVQNLKFRVPAGAEAVAKVGEAFPDCNESMDGIMKTFSTLNNSLSSLFFHYWNVNENHPGVSDCPAEWTFLQNQDPISLEILAVSFWGRFFATRSLVLDFFNRKGTPVPEADERIKRLETLGFLRFRPGAWGVCGRSEVLGFLESLEYLNLDQLNRDFSTYLKRRMEEDSAHCLSGLFFYLNSRGDVDFGLSVLNRIINHLLDLREIDLAQTLLDSPLFPQRKMSNSQQEGFHNIQYAGRLRCALLRRNRKDLAGKLNSGYLSLMQAQGDYSEEFLLQQAHYHGVNGDSDTALEVVKNSLFAFQKNSDHSGETRANIGLALTLLSQRKMQASIDYFEIATRIGEQLEDKISGLYSGRFMVLASYLFGNLSMALRLLEAQMPLIMEERNRETQIFLLFIKGRIFFELGRYSESFKVLKDALQLGKRCSMRQQIRVITAWMARSLCFGHSEKIALEMLDKQPDSLETAYFKAEAYYMAGDPAGGISLLEPVLESYDTSREFIHEMNCWEDGFRLIEGHLSDSALYEDVLLDQAKGFYYFLLGKTGRRQEALEGLKPLCRMDTAYNQQPFGYYFFFYAQDLMQEDEDMKDENFLILLSHSFKLLQTRAGRFDNQQMKHSFFRKNFWNNEIVKKAQELNFI